MFLGVKSGRLVGLTALPLSVSRMSEDVGASTSRNPKGLHRLYRDTFTFTLPMHLGEVCNAGSIGYQATDLNQHHP
jgi:hypothetical protein